MTMFSIIIPVYNVEKYLEKCLDSVIEQSYENWEAVCINDGSEDMSLELLENYAKKDARIRVCSQSNQGLAETRNVGISKAKGEWLLFIDSDDFIRSDTLETISKVVAEDNLDAISFETDILYEGDSKERDNKDSWYYKHHSYPGVVRGECLFEEMMRNDEYCDSACLLAVRKEWIHENSIAFYKGILYEDSIFSMKVFLNASRMRHIPEKLYTYRVREASIMTRGFTNENVRSRIIVFCELIKLINQREFAESVREQFYRYVYLVADHIRRMDKMCYESDELALDADNDFVAHLLNVCKYKTEVNTHIIMSGIEAMVKACDEVTLYGAGKVGSSMLYFLSSRGLKEKISCFVVSKIYEPDQSIQGIPVISIDEYENKGALVIICVMDRDARQDILINLRKKGIRNIEICDENMHFALEKFTM